MPSKQVRLPAGAYDLAAQHAETQGRTITAVLGDAVELYIAGLANPKILEGPCPHPVLRAVGDTRFCTTCGIKVR